MTNTRDASLTCDFFGAVTPLLTTGSGVGHGAWGRGALVGQEACAKVEAKLWVHA